MLNGSALAVLRRFNNILDSRNTLEKSLNSEDIVLKAKRRKQKTNILPNDILLQDLNWHVPRELTFLETKDNMKDVIGKTRLEIIALENKKNKKELMPKIDLTQLMS